MAGYQKDHRTNLARNPHNLIHEYWALTKIIQMCTSTV